jgi:hypothetical protein
MHRLVNDPYFVLLILFCAAAITIGAIVAALKGAEFAQSQNELKELSERVRELERACQRRFLGKLKSHSEGAEATYSTSGSGQLEAEREAAVQVPHAPPSAPIENS